MTSVDTAEFVVGAMAPNQFPKEDLPEIAIVGRSNVGKSSLINCLLNRKRLAKVGKTPGKTRQINFFLVNDAFWFVDLPGFGYAKVSKRERESWGGLIEGYLTSGRRVNGVVHLVDARHHDQESDMLMKEYLDSLGLARCLVATKTDKLKKSQLAKAADKVEKVHGQTPVMVSALKRSGVIDVWKCVDRWL